MTSLTFYGGVGEVGGNKILLRDRSTSIFLDFGKNFTRERQFYDEPYLSPREEKHLIYLGMLPEMEGLYKKDEAEPSVDAIVLSHPHADHWDYIRYVKDSVPIFCGETTKTMIIARELAGSGQRAEYKVASLTSSRGEEVFKDFRTFRSGDLLHIGSVELEPIHVDHSIAAARALRKHITPVDVFFYVLEGKGIVEVGEEKKEVEKDSIVYSPAKIVHCWYNESDNPLRILVTKTPKPKESTILL